MMIVLIHKVITLFKYISAYSNLSEGKITDVDLKEYFVWSYKSYPY
jgi:hypothetical protein